MKNGDVLHREEIISQAAVFVADSNTVLALDSNPHLTGSHCVSLVLNFCLWWRVEMKHSFTWQLKVLGGQVSNPPCLISEWIEPDVNILASLLAQSLHMLWLLLFWGCGVVWWGGLSITEFYIKRNIPM